MSRVCGAAGPLAWARCGVHPCSHLFSQIPATDNWRMLRISSGSPVLVILQGCVEGCFIPRLPCPWRKSVPCCCSCLFLHVGLEMTCFSYHYSAVGTAGRVTIQVSYALLKGREGHWWLEEMLLYAFLMHFNFFSFKSEEIIDFKYLAVWRLPFGWFWKVVITWFLPKQRDSLGFMGLISAEVLDRFLPLRRIEIP